MVYKKLLLLSTLIITSMPLTASLTPACPSKLDVSAVVLTEEEAKEEERSREVAETKGGCKTIKGNLTVCNNLTVKGSETVTGTVTAARFLTPTGGPNRTWAVFSNTVAVTSIGAIIPWIGTSAASL